MSPDDPAPAAADIIAASFGGCVERFRQLTNLARGNFERRDWHTVQKTSGLRLDVYTDIVAEALAALDALLGPRLADAPLWTEIRAAYADRVRDRADVELAETFFNSVTRRIFHTIGVDPAIEFVAPETPPPRYGPPWSVTATFARRGSLEELVRRALSSFRFDAPWDDLDGDCRRVADALRDDGLGERARGFELVRAPFFRGKGAYLAGALDAGGARLPLVFALTNPAGRIVVDAALFTEREVSIVFSFARAYFFVDAGRPRELVDFLRSIMPRKPVSEIYNALGFNKHGKTELYRALLRHLATADERFETAPGQRGMVMTVFTMPRLDIVFKVIRDRFDYPKTVTHQEVRDKYRLVFRHDRAGRLVDAQEFEHVEFDRERFSPPLLEQLVSLASETVQVRGDKVVIRHLYTERRLRPLDLYLRGAEREAAREAVLDYGQTMRDLAATNIFPGDMLLKNFGVSRRGRLIFYDYDELCRLTDCNFRVLPRARTDAEETAEEPWFYVGERDIFPEEFRTFLGLKGDLLETFVAAHGELFDVAWWRRMQELHARGEVLDVYPYKATRRLRLRAQTSAGADGARRRGAAT